MSIFCFTRFNIATYIALSLFWFSVQANATIVTLTTVPSAYDSSRIFIILNKAYTSLGIEPKLVILPSARSLEQANAGIYDGELARPKGIERYFPNLIPVDMPISEYSYTFARIQGDKYQPVHLKDLTDKDVGYPRGDVFLRSAFQRKSSMEAADGKMLLGLLNTKRLTYAVAGYGQMEDFRDAFPEVELVRDPIITQMLYHYLHVDRIELVDSLAEQLRILFAVEARNQN